MKSQLTSKFTRLRISGFLAGLLASGLLVAAVSAHEEFKRALNPPELANSLQYGYSQATIAAADAKLIHVAGQVGISEDGPNDFESQVDRAFDALLATLDVADTNAENVVKITLLIVDHDAEKLAYLVEKRKAVFGDNPPASTLIPVPVLYAPGVLFEIDAVAVASGSI
ncbi:RidA family protein [Leptolyngbya cf. ectocarpi LEGE 11479]|uniref:RidA family protein n=1 Tax=Leptolyngbya cf. ectocarpi LEGE 11479 TaxID=1828722 RepID=A0A928ZVD0_LEPEC|nr:RidA family protein [Leptolyngbya ectocarpi]MBE9068177.1 RidA family protein [Leptolyngbya cf. ectocarpi LEGE 11479]